MADGWFSVYVIERLLGFFQDFFLSWLKTVVTFETVILKLCFFNIIILNNKPLFILMKVLSLQ